MNNSKSFISHYTAARIWQISYLDQIFMNLDERSEKAHITYLKRGERNFRHGQITHLCQTPLPSNAVLSSSSVKKVIGAEADSENTRPNLKIASPELVFLQLATELNLHQLTLLGLQMCSFPPGQPQKAVTSKQKLCNFIKKAPGLRGVQKSAHALRFIENGSASVMESFAFMVLSLPNHLGGYGLGKPIFNYEIKLRDEGKQRLGQKRCFLDLYYKEAKLVVEYDSFAFHNSPSEQGKDAMRSVILESQGIGTMSLSTLQLHNPDACRDFAHNLAKRIGRRVQIRTAKFDAAHAQLRGLFQNDR